MEYNEENISFSIKKINPAHIKSTKTHAGIPIPEPGYQCRPQPLDVVFLVDGSRSIRPNNFEIIKQYVRETIPVLAPISPKDTQVAILQFGSIVRQEISLNSTYRVVSQKCHENDRKWPKMAENGWKKAKNDQNWPF